MKKLNISILVATLVFVSFVFSAQAQTTNPITKSLFLGVKDQEVSVLQQFLKDHGFFLYPEITQYFGPVTQTSLVEFQKTHGIDPFGIVGPITRAKISELLTIKKPVSFNELKKKSGSKKSSRNREEVDTTAPTASISSPTNLTAINSNATITATASDNVGVVGVQFQLDDVNIGTEDTTSPYTFDWDITDVIDGEYAFKALTRDEAGNGYTSNPITLTVDRVNPALAITFPTDTSNHTPGSITYQVTATDNTAIAGVTYTLIPFGTTTPMFSTTQTTFPYSLVSPFVPEGFDYTLQVTATDTAGNTDTEQITYSSVEPG